MPIMSSPPSASIPATMRAAQGAGYGDIDRMLSVEDGVPVPRLSDPYDPVEPIHPLIRLATKQDRKTHMIIRTLAVALAPGDCRVLSGLTRLFQGPPSFPYAPGGDCCGIVVEVSEGEKYFAPGDLVVARFTVAPRDGLGQYARVSSTVCDRIPIGTVIGPAEAAALVSASPAVCVSDYVRPNERVLILGAGGGVGSHLCQLARTVGKAAYVCGVSRSPQRLLDAPLLCDDAIDYTKEDVLESERYRKDPFDTIIDFAAVGTWPKLVENARNDLPSIVKPASQGGRYITITSDAPTFELRTFGGILQLFMFKPLYRYWASRLFTRNRLPTFTQANGLPDNRAIVTRTLKLTQEGKLTAVVDGPHEFTTEGVRKAFRTLESRHGKGKIVVKVADDDQPPPTDTKKESPP
jgi:NADPH:quinone reductase-like Zn-dependent oxidoreductase